MKNKIKEIATLLIYCGPTIEEIITDAIGKGNKYDIKNTDYSIEVTVSSTTAYDLHVIDKYIYDNEYKLVKQTLTINNKEKIIFNKYKEAMELVEQIEQESICIA